MQALLDFVRSGLGAPGLAMLLSSPQFAFTQLLNSISFGMNLFIIAVGLSMIFGVLRTINFAHGSFYMFGAYIVYTAVNVAELSFWSGIALSAVTLAMMAAVIERTLFRFIYDKGPLLQLLLTFALVLILGDLAKFIWGTDEYNVPYPISLDGMADLGISNYPAYRVFLGIVGPLIAIAFWLFVERTRWGRLTRAATQDREMLAALGVNVSMVYTSVFVVGSALAGMGGALAAPMSSIGPGMDATIIVQCFVIVIIGGLGSLWGTFIGALIYGFVFIFGSVIIPQWQDVFIFLLLLTVLMVRPWGLFGSPEARSR